MYMKRQSSSIIFGILPTTAGLSLYAVYRTQFLNTEKVLDSILFCGHVSVVCARGKQMGREHFSTFTPNLMRCRGGETYSPGMRFPHFCLPSKQINAVNGSNLPLLLRHCLILHDHVLKMTAFEMWRLAIKIFTDVAVDLHETKELSDRRLPRY